MAPSYSNSLTKALLLVLGIIAVATVPAICIAEEGATEIEATSPHATAGSRFLVEKSAAGRRLLNFNFCGFGSAPNYSCKTWFPLFKNAQCCTDPFGFQVCWDVGAYLDLKCGSCTNKCSFGTNCCSGVCVDKQSDPNNCGWCGNKCKGNLPCRRGLCGYGQEDEHF